MTNIRYKLITLTTISLLYICIANTAVAAVFYVATNGSTANTGLSTDSPWDLRYALQHIGPSNTVIVMPGTWTGQDLEISQPYTVLQSQIKWGARLLAEPYGICFGNKSVHDVVIDGFEIAYCPKQAVKPSGLNCVVRNCWIHDCATNYYVGVAGIQATSDIGIEPDNLLIEGNLIERIGTPGNVLTQHGIYVNGKNITVRNNVCRFNVSAGIQFWDAAEAGTTNANIYNNLCYGNGTWGLVVGSKLGSVYANVFCNTLVCTNIAVGAVVSEGQAAYLACTNNILMGGSFVAQIHIPGAYSIVGDFNVMNKIDNLSTGSHSILTNDAGFVDPNNGLYWITTKSAAIGGALPTACGPVSFFGQPESHVSDIGAFQYNSSYAADTRAFLSLSSPAEYWSILGTLAAPTGLRVIAVTNK